MGKRTGLIIMLVAGFLAAVTIIGCQEEAATGPQVTDVNLARRGTTDTVPDVTGADPASAPQDTTLDVKVSGSGFDHGSAVVLTLGGVATEKVRTNSTRYRNAKTLIANITIAADAEVDLYDVEVMTARGKKGIGTEMFEVKVRVQGNATSVSVELLEPATGEGDVGDPYNLRSGGPRQAWRTDDGNGMTLEMHDFPLTLAFSQADADAMTDPTTPVEGECPVVHEWLFGSENRLGLQERGVPLRGLLTFTYGDDVASIQFRVHDPFDEGGKYTYIMRFSGGRYFSGDLTVVPEPDGMTFIIEGSNVSLGKWGYGKDPYKISRPLETPWCKVHVTDFTLRLRE